MKKKLVALLMAAAMVGSIGGVTASADGPVEIEFWAPINEGTTAEESSHVRNVEDFNAQYEGQYKINLIAIGADNAEIEQKYQMAASAGNIPDLMIMNSGKELADYIGGGHFTNMSDYLNVEEFTSKFPEGALTLQGNGQYDESHMYGVPTGADVQGWFYNKALFEQCGLEIPETFDDLLNCVAVFKENGITPLMHGGLDQWPLWGYWPWFSSLGFTQEANQWDAFGDGSMKVADCEGMVKTFEYIQQLADAGAYPDNVANLNNTQAQEMFMAGAAAMYCGGNWMAADMDECDIAEDIVFDWGPQFEDSIYDQTVAMRPYSWIYAFGSKIGDDEAKKEAITAYMNFVFDEERAIHFVETEGTAPSIILSDNSVLENLGPVSSQMAKAGVEDGVVSVIDPNSWCEYDGSVTVIWNAMTAIITGTIDAEEAISQMQDWADRLQM